MYKINIDGITIEFVKGNIVKQPDLIAVVNSANPHLITGSGVAGAIHNTAGPDLEKECRTLAPIRPGEAVITQGHNLHNDFIIHSVGPVYGEDEAADELLRQCYQNSLKLAEENKIVSIGFPSISTGNSGYPLKEAAEIALESIQEYFIQLDYVKLIRFVLFKQVHFNAYQKVAQKMFS
ncbi:MAG: macro domain-containing protein [Bacillota bacterium]